MDKLFAEKIFPPVGDCDMDEGDAMNLLIHMAERWDSPWLDEKGAFVAGGQLEMDGKFYANELLAIVWWLRNHPGERLPMQQQEK